MGWLIHLALYIGGFYTLFVFLWTAGFVLRQALQEKPKNRLNREIRDLELHIHAVIALAPMYWVCNRSFKPWIEQYKSLKQKRERLIELMKAFESS